MLKIKETLARILTTLTERGNARTATATVNVSAGIGTISRGAALTLPAGTYLLIATAGFPTGSGARNLDVRYAENVGVYLNGNEQEISRVVSAYGDWASLQACAVRTATSQMTYEAGASSSVAVNGVRLKLQSIRLS